MKIAEREKAIQLRKEGVSIQDIAKTLSVSKGSVSLWVRNIQLSKIQLKKLSLNSQSIESIEKRRQSRISLEKEKKNIIKSFAHKEIDQITLSELRLIGISLYLGEGGKTKPNIVRVANSDPEIIRIMMLFFRKCMQIPESKFRGYIHTHDISNVAGSEKYWSKITDIPLSQFYKTYFIQSIASLKKRKTLPYGTFEININDTKAHLRLMGWMERLKIICDISKIIK